MKSKKNYKNGSHTFLFWLVLPILLVWLSVGYIAGIVRDKPIWSLNDKSREVNQAVPYFQDYGSLLIDLHQPFVTFWFDDAWLSQYNEAYPILKKNNFPASVAIAVNAVEHPNYMNWAQLRAVQKDGWETNDHSLAHDCTMQKWDRNKITREFRTSRLIIWKNKLSADIFVTPCGIDSKVMREEALKVFTAYRTVNPGFNDPKSVNPYDLKVKNIDDKTTVSDIKSWIDEAKKTQTWVILVFHKVGEKHEFEGDDKFNISKESFETIVNYVKESKIKVVIPSLILNSQSYEK